MSAANEIYVVLNCEFANNLLSKSETHSAIVVSELLNATLWVRPKQVAQQSWVGYIGWPNYIFDLLKVFQFWWEAAVHAQNFLIDDRTNGQAIEYVWEYFPEFNGVATFAFVIEAVNTIDLSAFMIAAEQEEIFWVFDFVTQQQSDRLDRLLAPVNVVSQEEVVRLWGKTSVLEYS